MIQTFSEAADIVRSTIKSGYPQVKKAYIFGSFADGLNSVKSDLDIVVELDASIGLRFISMIQDIENAAGMKVDVLTLHQVEDLEKRFGYNIIRKAKPVYERTTN